MPRKGRKTCDRRPVTGAFGRPCPWRGSGISAGRKRWTVQGHPGRAQPARLSVASPFGRLCPMDNDVIPKEASAELEEGWDPPSCPAAMIVSTTAKAVTDVPPGRAIARRRVGQYIFLRDVRRLVGGVPRPSSIIARLVRGAVDSLRHGAIVVLVEGARRRNAIVKDAPLLVKRAQDLDHSLAKRSLEAVCMPTR